MPTRAFFICTLSIMALFGMSSCRQERKAQTIIPAADRDLASQLEKSLRENILHVWYPKILDQEQGGFLTNFSFDWQPVPPHPKMIVSQARDVWTACKAAERYPDDPRYRQAADHGFRFFQEQMWDSEHGGFTFYLDQTATPYKKSYGQAFGIYALAAYAKLTGSPESLNFAQRAFRWFDDHCHDPVHGGYFDWITLDGISAADKRYDRKLFPANAGHPDWKDFNSSIHILEAFTELYEVWPDPLLHDRLQEMLKFVRDTFTADKGFLQLYFQPDWSAVSYRDSSRSVQMANLNWDYVSFGHDIETAFLLLEAAHALGQFHDAKTLAVSRKLIDHTLANGFDTDYAGIVDGGYYYDLNAPITILKKSKNWWSQAEGLNALLLYSKLYPQETRYRKAFDKLWRYVDENFIDHEHGDWYAEGLDVAPEIRRAAKAHAWKSCYHNGRALMHCIDLLQGKSKLLD